MTIVRMILMLPLPFGLAVSVKPGGDSHVWCGMVPRVVALDSFLPGRGGPSSTAAGRGRSRQPNEKEQACCPAQLGANPNKLTSTRLVITSARTHSTAPTPPRRPKPTSGGRRRVPTARPAPEGHGMATRRAPPPPQLLLLAIVPCRALRTQLLPPTVLCPAFHAPFCSF
jgi:hypothetical protein